MHVAEAPAFYLCRETTPSRSVSRERLLDELFAGVRVKGESGMKMALLFRADCAIRVLNDHERVTRKPTLAKHIAHVLTTKLATDKTFCTMSRSNPSVGLSSPTRRSWFRKKRKVHRHRDELSSISQQQGERSSNNTNIHPCNSNLESIKVSLNRYFKPQSRGDGTADPWAKFDDTTPYDVTEAQEAELRHLEAQRLLSVAETDKPLTLDSGGVLDGQESKFQKIADVADQVWCNLNVMICDNESLVQELHPELSVESQYGESCRLVEERLSSSMKHKNPRKLENQNTPVYHSFVDHVTGTVARLLIRCVAIESFQTTCLAVLAEMSTKLKVLQIDPVRYAEISLERCESAETRIEGKIHKPSTGPGGHRYANGFRHRAQSPPGGRSWSDFQEHISSLERDRKFKLEDDINQSIYYLDMVMHRAFILEVVKTILLGVIGTKTVSARLARQSVDAFDISSLVYEAGFSSQPTLVCQDRNGEFTASSAPRSLRASFEAFRILLQTTRFLGETQTNQPISGPSISHSRLATIEWRWETLELEGRSTEVNLRADHDHGRRSIETMDHLVSLIVPLLCTGATVSSTVAKLTNLIMSMASHEAFETPEEQKFAAFFCMRSYAYHESQHSLKGTVPLSDSSLVRQPAIKVTTLDLSGTRNRGRQDTFQFVRARRQDFQELEEMIKQKWVIDSESIIVRCDRYVLTVAALCMGLVIGGVIIGLTVGNRVTAVDPFGITTFCWAFAAFIIIVAKSLLVESWSWRDFLLRRCKCRSVSELSSVSGVPVQLIIAYLLHNEDSLVLNVRGPFDAAFRFEGGSDSFSIDEEPNLGTLLLGGIIMVTVATLRGPALVGLHARRSGEVVGIPHFYQVPESDKGQRDSHIVCVELPRQRGDKRAADTKLENLVMSWYQVYGVYDVLDCKFC